MADLTPLILLSSAVTENPTEQNLEAFLQAYNATTEPENQVELMLFEMLGDLTLTEYMEPECTCEHEHLDE